LNADIQPPGEDGRVPQLLAPVRRVLDRLTVRTLERWTRNDPELGVEFWQRGVVIGARRWGPYDRKTLLERLRYAKALHQAGRAEEAAAEAAGVIEALERFADPGEGLLRDAWA
jgi:hypothetical protein